MECKAQDTLVLDKNLPEFRLKKGDLGAVVQVHKPDGLGVEFVTAAGKTQALVTLDPRDGNKNGDACTWLRMDPG